MSSAPYGTTHWQAYFLAENFLTDTGTASTIGPLRKTLTNILRFDRWIEA